MFIWRNRQRQHQLGCITSVRGRASIRVRVDKGRRGRRHLIGSGVLMMRKRCAGGVGIGIGG